MSGKSQSPTTTQTSEVKLSPEQREMFGLAFPYARKYAMNPLKQFEGTGIADFNPDEALAQARLKNSVVPQLDDLAASAASSNKMLMDPKFMLDVENNEYLRGATRAMTGDVTRNLMENIMPGVRAGAIQQGGMYGGGSSRQGIAEGLAIGRTNQGLSDATARMMFDAYNRGLSGIGEAINRNPSVQGQQLFGSEVLAGVGAQKRSMEQAKLDEKIRQFYTGQQLPMLQAQELMSLIQGMPGGQTVSTATGSVPRANPLMAGLGGAASGAMLGGMVMPGVGHAGGAAIGALLSLLMNR